MGCFIVLRDYGSVGFDTLPLSQKCKSVGLVGIWLAWKATNFMSRFSPRWLKAVMDVIIIHIYICFRNTWWRHQIETFSALLAICAGNSPVPGEFPTQRPVTQNFVMFSLICARINSWVNNGEAGDLGHNRAHYDVTVMWMIQWCTGACIQRAMTILV